MELKKSDKANLEKYRMLFLEAGLCVALLFCLLAFEWSSSPRENSSFIPQVIETLPEEEVIPITRQQEIRQPAPPKPKLAEVLTIVKDDVDLDEMDITLDVEIEDVEQITDLMLSAGGDIEEEEEEDFFTIVEQMPTFQGGDLDKFRQWVNKNITYPMIARENGIEGTVRCEFIVNAQGHVENVKVLRSVVGTLDAEAVRVLSSSPQWSPGRQQGKAVKVKVNIPIVFRLTR